MQAVLLFHFKIYIPSPASDYALTGQLDSQRHILTPFSMKQMWLLHLNLFWNYHITSPRCWNEFPFSPFNSYEISSVGFHLTEAAAPAVWVVKEQKQLLHRSNVFWKYFMLKIQKNTSCSKKKNILHDNTYLGLFRRCLWLRNQSLEWWPNLAANGSFLTSQSFIKARIILWQKRKHDTSGLLKHVQVGTAIVFMRELHLILK